MDWFINPGAMIDRLTQFLAFLQQCPSELKEKCIKEDSVEESI